MRLRPAFLCVLMLALLAASSMAACGVSVDSTTSTRAPGVAEATSTSGTVVTTTSPAGLPTPSTSVSRTTTTTAPTASETTYPSTTTVPPVTTGLTLPDLSGSIPAPPAGVSTVAMSPVALLMEEPQGGGRSRLHAHLFAAKRLVELPVGDDVYVNGMDIAGDLAVWAERQVSDEPGATCSVYAYRLPNGPKVTVVGDAPSAFDPCIDGGRVFWAQGIHVSGDIDQLEEVLSTQVIWMVKVDDGGNPLGPAVEVTNQPNSSHGPGGDELWSYDVEGSYLAYQRMYGSQSGVHLVDLDSGEDTYLGEGSIPSVSGSLVAWRGEPRDAGWQVWGHNLETGRVAVLAEDGHMPFAGPGYVIYAQHGADGSGNDLYLLDETTGSMTLLGRTTMGRGWPFIPIAGNSDYGAWVTGITTTPGEVAGTHYGLRLVALPEPLGFGEPVRDIWAGAQAPPKWAE